MKKNIFARWRYVRVARERRRKKSGWREKSTLVARSGFERNNLRWQHRRRQNSIHNQKRRLRRERSESFDFVDDENTKYNVDVLKKFIDNKNDFGFIAKINNKIVGFAFGYILLKPDGRKVFYLDAIDVMPDYQGKGYGTGLISFARDYAKTIDCYKMYLITNRSNISACKCYEKAGGINKVDDEIIYVYDFKEKN